MKVLLACPCWNELMVFGLGDKKEKDKQEIQRPQNRFDAKYLLVEP